MTLRATCGAVLIAAALSCACGSTPSIGPRPSTYVNPLSLESVANTISSLTSVGEKAYTVSQLVLADPGRRAWLQPYAPTSPTQSGLYDTEVVRLASGYAVTLPKGTTIRPQELDTSLLLPVVSVSYAVSA